MLLQWKKFGVAALLLAAAGTAGCSGSDGGTQPTTLESITVAPATVTLASGAAQDFTATGRYSDGSTRSETVTWSAAGGTISSAGTYTAGSTPGEYRVIATGQGGLADTALVTIPAPPPPGLVAIEVTPPTATVASGQTQAFTAVGRLSDNTTTAVPVTWSATGGTVSGGGVYTAGNTPGTYRVVATEVGGAGLADTSTITVTASLVAVELTPAAVVLATGATQQFTAVGRYSDNSTQAVTVDWTATGGSITAAGLYTAGNAAGTTYRVIAKLAGGALADTSAVTITAAPPTIVGLQISPDSAHLGPFATQQFSAVGLLAGGGTTPVTVSWTTTQATVPTFSGPPNSVSTGGLFTAGYPVGRYLVIAAEVGGTHADTVPVRIYNTTGQSVPVFPGDNLSFWTPEPGVVKLCTSNHYTDDPAGLGGTATVTAAQGTVTSPVAYTTLDSVQYADGSGAVKVECRPVWTAPGGLVGSVRVTIAVASKRPGSGIAKVFVYENSNNPQGRADYTKEQDFTPGMTTATVTEFVDASLANGANIWFKSTIVP